MSDFLLLMLATFVLAIAGSIIAVGLYALFGLIPGIPSLREILRRAKEGKG